VKILSSTNYMLIICCGILLLTNLLDITLIKGQTMHVGCLYLTG